MSALLESCGYEVREIDGDKLDDRDCLSILQDQPFAIILPLSLPAYMSLRIAELVALTQRRIRLILMSGTRAPSDLLEDLFDRHLPPLGDGLIPALQQEKWVHALERRSVTVDTAIERILKEARCFFANSHGDSWQTLVDYQRKIAEKSRHFSVLFLASDPADLARLHLLKELSEVQNELSRPSAYSFALNHVFSSRPDELARKILEVKPHIVHFSGHGDSRGGLCFEDAGGRSWPADMTAIAQMFEPCRRYVKCVLLNACFSADQAAMIGEYIEYTAGLSAAVSDDAAIALAKGFYGALSVSGRVSNALRAARANLRLLAGDATELHFQERTHKFCGSAPGPGEGVHAADLPKRSNGWD
jgi:hypothetical protein